MSGAVPPPAARPLVRAARFPRPVCPGCGSCGRGDPAPGPQRAPLRAGVARCAGGGRAFPGGVPSTILRGVWGQALSLPRLPAHSAGCWGPPPTCCGRGCVGVGAQHCPLCLHALWGLRAAGVVGGRPRGGWPATVVRGAWCQALSLPRPPVLWSGQPGFCDPCVPGAVGAGVGTQHWPHHCEGRLRSGAVPPPTARPLGGLSGLVGCVRCVWCLCRACRGARCRSSLVPLVLPSPVSRCGVVLAVCLPCPLPCARLLLGRWLPLVPVVASLLFTLSSTLLPGVHFFPASALVRVSVFFLAGSSFSLVGPSPLNLRRERMQTGVRRRGFCRDMARRQCHPRSVSTPAAVWYVTYLCFVRVLLTPVSYRVVLVTAFFFVRRLA